KLWLPFSTAEVGTTVSPPKLAASLRARFASSVATLSALRSIGPTLAFTFTFTLRSFSQLRTLAILATATLVPDSLTLTQVQALLRVTMAIRIDNVFMQTSSL